MSQSIAFQIINGYLAVIGLCCFVIFLRYLYENCHLGYRELRPAIAFLVVWAGNAILRGPIFYQRTRANMGLESVEPTYALFIGGSLLIMGFLCCIRVFSPVKWGHWSWILSLLLSTIIVIGSVALVYWR